jgi:hypothetical protein
LIFSAVHVPQLIEQYRLECHKIILLFSFLASVGEMPKYSLSLGEAENEGISSYCGLNLQQSRMSRRSDERDHLILQILMLTEKEITAAPVIERQIADSMGIEKVAKDVGIERLTQETSIDAVAQEV